MAKNSHGNVAGLQTGWQMRIAIDGRWILKELSGIPAYTLELIKQLARIDRDNEYIIFFNNAEIREKTVRETGIAERANFTTCMLDSGVFSLKNQLVTPFLLSKQGIDVFHSPNYMIPFAAFPGNKQGKTACIVNIHDMIPMVFPDHAPKSKKRRLFPLYKKVMQETGHRADRIITASQSAKNDIIKFLHVPGEKISVIPDGVDERFTPAPESRQDIPNKRKIFWAGRLDPYKNVTGLIAAFAKATEQTGLQLELRLAGPPDSRYPEARDKAVSLGLTDKIQWLGYLSNEALVNEYRQADVFVLPSGYEGFGLTVLEAMACGTPVICSNASSLPEVAGDAAILVDPHDTDAMAEAILRVLTNKKLAADMIEQGLQRASSFTWQNTARGTITAYLNAKS